MNKIKHVKILFAPVSERYWHIGCKAKIDGKQIRVGGAWFNYDPKTWKIFN